MADSILAPTFLFRFAVPCQHVEKAWPAREMELPPEYTIPSFGELEDRPMFADLRIGWSVSGLAVSVRVRGKKQTPWCRESRLEDSDGLSLWIDTRNTHSVHRATRFCHRFVFLPQGGGAQQQQPLAQWFPIHLAKENPKTVANELLKIRAEKRVDGYLLRAFIPAIALTGYDPEEQPRLGFTYAITDRELGWQTFTIGSEFPFLSDPSLWGTLELVPHSN
jgi:hypothetical protein